MLSSVISPMAFDVPDGVSCWFLTCFVLCGSCVRIGFGLVRLVAKRFIVFVFLMCWKFSFIIRAVQIWMSLWSMEERENKLLRVKIYCTARKTFIGVISHFLVRTVGCYMNFSHFKCVSDIYFIFWKICEHRVISKLLFNSNFNFNFSVIK